MNPVLVLASDERRGHDLAGLLAPRHEVDIARDLAGCLESFRARRYEYTFIDLDKLCADRAADREALGRALEPFRQAWPTAHIIVLVEPSGVGRAVEAVRAGADRYLTYPVDPAELEYVLTGLGRMVRLTSELNHLREGFWREDARELTRTASTLMGEVLEKIRSVAPTRTTVLLTGETGTGKTEMAKLIHAHSNRAQGPFIAVHCGAIPDTLLESELFGHEKGAFTGAYKRKLGKFQVAHGGTIFLDEIGTITPAAQVKLLQVLQERTINRVGGELPLEVDVRVVAASNADLGAATKAGTFRPDLFYRLNVFPIDLPPLCQRPEDIALMVDTFLGRLNRLYDKDIQEMEPGLAEALTAYAWPGNIRELENLVERAYILERGRRLSRDGFPAELFSLTLPGRPVPGGAAPTLAQVRARAVDEAERRYLKEVLTTHKGRVDKSAAAAGVTSRQFHNLMSKHGLHREDFR